MSEGRPPICSLVLCAYAHSFSRTSLSLFSAQPPWPSLVVHGSDAISVCLVRTSVFVLSPFAT